MSRYSVGKQPCDSTSCQYLFTYDVINDTDVVELELSGTADWVAVGFSSDQKMVNVLQCTVCTCT